MNKPLIFSEPFLNADYVSQERNYSVSDKSVLINIDSMNLDVGGLLLPPLKSMIIDQTNIDAIERAILITMPEGDFFENQSSLDKNIIHTSWSHIYDLLNLPQLKNTKLWRSAKVRIENQEFNLWFAPAGTKCGLHKDHEFLEVHTQIYGLGKMQKFHENNENALYHEVYMSPGYSHDPFYTEEGSYPWHQYEAITDCIWLAIEEY